MNRWTAARDGLQARLWWEGRARPVCEVLEELMERSAGALEALGSSRERLPMIGEMLRKRVTQADYWLTLAERYPEANALGSAMGKLARHWDAFDGWLEGAPTLEPKAAVDEDEVMRLTLEYVGDGTHFYVSREAMQLPGPAADALLERMLAEGLVERDVHMTDGSRLSRRD